MLLFSTDAVTPNSLLYEVARHNFTTYVVKDFDLELMNFGPLGLLIVKGFSNQAELNHYRSLLARDGTFTMPEAVRPVEISKSNFEKLLQGAGSFDDYFRFTGEEAIKAADASVEEPETETEAETVPEPAVPGDGEETPELPDIVPTDPIAPVEITPPPAGVEVEPEPEPEEHIAPQPGPESKPEPKPAPVTAPEPAPQPVAPALPSYPIGSEGDEDD